MIASRPSLQEERAEQHPQEVGVALDPLARGSTPSRALRDQVLSVAQADVSVVEQVAAVGEGVEAEDQDGDQEQ